MLSISKRRKAHNNYVSMIEKRLRDKMLHVWLHEKEHKFLNKYAVKNMPTSSEIIRGWIHAVMKSEGYELKEPRNPEDIKKGGKK